MTRGIGAAHFRAAAAAMVLLLMVLLPAAPQWGLAAGMLPEGPPGLVVTRSAETPEAAYRRRAERLGWSDEGLAAEEEEIDLRFWVKLSHTADFRHALDDISNPNSPTYGHYLSQAQVDVLIAPTAEDVAIVRGALQGQMIHEESDGAIISARVLVGFANNLVGGAFRRFCRGAGPDAECALRNPSAEVPASLRDACDIISPLDEPLAPVSREPFRQGARLSNALASSIEELGQDPGHGGWTSAGGPAGIAAPVALVVLVAAAALTVGGLLALRRTEEERGRPFTSLGSPKSGPREPASQGLRLSAADMAE